jgi:hypothetical protein
LLARARVALVPMRTLREGWRCDRHRHDQDEDPGFHTITSSNTVASKHL